MIKRWTEERPDVVCRVQMSVCAALLAYFCLYAMIQTAENSWSLTDVFIVASGGTFSVLGLVFGTKTLKLLEGTKEVRAEIRNVNARTAEIRERIEFIKDEMMRENQNKTPMLTELMRSVDTADTGVVDDKETSGR